MDKKKETQRVKSSLNRTIKEINKIANNTTLLSKQFMQLDMDKKLTLKQTRKAIHAMRKQWEVLYTLGHVTEDINSALSKTTVTTTNRARNNKSKPTTEERNIINYLTDDIITAIDRDIEIEQEELKYTMWVSAASTAGLSICLIKAEMIMRVSAYAFLSISVVFLVSIVLAALIRGRFLESFSVRRIQQCFFDKQRATLLSHPEKLANDTGRIQEKMRFLGFAEESERSEYIITDLYLKLLGRENLEKAQQKLTFIGYAALVLCTFFYFLY